VRGAGQWFDVGLRWGNGLDARAVFLFQEIRILTGIMKHRYDLNSISYFMKREYA
jgi:hypothetical protein